MGGKLKILLTGDNHIGLRYLNHSKSSEIAAFRISAFDGIVSAANDEGCELLVISGDLFDRTRNIKKQDIHAVAEKLAAFSGTVCVLPGNHDYYDPDVKVWQQFAAELEGRDNILFMHEPRPYRIDSFERPVILYPVICTALHSEKGANGLGWIKAALAGEKFNDGAIRIGVAHGAVEGETIDNEGLYYCMSRSELASIPVDCWLIGHTHVPFPHDITADFTACGRIFNAGTHVQTDVNCSSEGLCFVIEIDEYNDVTAKKLVSGGLRFYRKQVNAVSGGLLSAVKNAVFGLPDQSVVDLVLSGAVSESEYEDRYNIISSCTARFLEVNPNCSGLTKLITKDFIDSEFAETSLPAKLLTALLDEPAEAQLVYDLINSLKGGKA